MSKDLMNQKRVSAAELMQQQKTKKDDSKIQEDNNWKIPDQQISIKAHCILIYGKEAQPIFKQGILRSFYNWMVENTQKHMSYDKPANITNCFNSCSQKLK